MWNLEFRPCCFEFVVRGLGCKGLGIRLGPEFGPCPKSFDALEFEVWGLG